MRPHDVFCDYLTVTVPKDDFEPVLREVDSVLHELCCEAVGDLVWRCPLGGTFQAGLRGSVGWIQASGGAMGALRVTSLLAGYLCCYSVRPHRVTRLDATLDMPIESPVILSTLYSAAKAGGVRLSRKAIQPSQVSSIMSPSLYGASQDTGTVYLGRKTAEVLLKVYDKRQELIARTGVDPGHNITRYEVTVRAKQGPTLRDVMEPAGLFYHFLSPDILKAPQGVSEWRPFTDGGYTVVRQETLPYELLKRRVESSRELAKLIQLADQCGPHGFDLLVSLMRRFHSSSAKPKAA